MAYRLLIPAAILLLLAATALSAMTDASPTVLDALAGDSRLSQFCAIVRRHPDIAAILRDDSRNLIVLAPTDSAAAAAFAGGAGGSGGAGSRDEAAMLRRMIVEPETEFVNNAGDGSELLGRALDGSMVRWHPPGSEKAAVMGGDVMAALALARDGGGGAGVGLLGGETAPGVKDIMDSAGNGMVFVIDGGV